MVLGSPSGAPRPARHQKDLDTTQDAPWQGVPSCRHGFGPARRREMGDPAGAASDMWRGVGKTPVHHRTWPKRWRNRDRGEPRGSTPPTPPCVRVRTRRFGWLSVATNAGLWDTRSAADGSALARQPSGLHPYSLPGRPAMLVFCRFPPARSTFLLTTPTVRAFDALSLIYYALC